MSDDEPIKQEPAPEGETAKTEREAAKAAAAKARAERIAEHQKLKAALAARKAKAAEVRAVREGRRAEKRQAKDAEKEQRKTKTPEQLAEKEAVKAAKRKAKEAREAKAAQTAAERAARKAEKRKADENKPASDPAAKAERKAAKLKAKEEANAARRATTPEEQAAKEQQKAAKRREKESAKAARDAEAAETAAARAARKADKPQAETEAKPPVDPAAKAERKAAKRKAKEEARAARRVKSPEEQAAKEQQKAAKQAAKEAKKTKAEPLAPTADDLAAKEARKAAKRQAKESALAAREAEKAEKAQPEAKAPVDPAAKAERKAAKHKAKEEAKAARRVKSPEEQAAKEQQKAAKQAAKEAKAVPAASEGDPAADAAAKAERKAAKHKAKEEAKAARRVKSPEEQAAKEQQKAAKQAAKDAKETPAADEGEAGDGDAAKAERKAAKHQAKEAAKAARRTKSPDEQSAKDQEKAAKHAAKEAKKARADGVSAEKAERRAGKGAGDETPEEKAARKAAKKQGDVAEDPDKAAKKAAKQQAKAERKAAKENSPEDAAAKAERKAKKKAAKGEDGEGGERAIRLSIAGANAEDVTPLGAALQAAFAAAGTHSEAPKPEGKCDMVVHTFDDADAATIETTAATAMARQARVHVFVETLEESGAVNRAIARLAAQAGGAVVSTGPRFRRFGLDQMSSDGRPNEKGIALIAGAIVGIGSARVPRQTFTPPPGEAPPDLVEARAAAERPMDLLGKLRWSSMTPPRALGTNVREEEVVAFADSKVVVSEEFSIALANPIDWSVELPDRKAGYTFNGLDFLASPLAYWYAKANNQGSDRTAAIDAALKERGTNPAALFARVAQILVEFIDKHPRATAPKLWEETILMRRAPVLAMFVLCCRVAYRRKLKFNESAFTRVYDSLLDHAEVLRSDEFYIPGSTDGIEQDRLLIGIALALRGTPYGNQLMTDGLDRLKRLQVEPGLSAEGVWMGDSYGKHNAALTEITAIFGDFPPTESALLEPFAAATKKMTLFSEAMLKSNGQPPAFDGTKERVYSNKISGMRKSIARATGKSVSSGKSALTSRITDTYVFREAQYFISHSQQKVVPESSLVVLHAAPPSLAHDDPGGVKLVFAYNESNLLIRAEPVEVEGADGKPDETDPALRNFYRVDGKGNLPPEVGSTKIARMVKSWRGPGWAAAKAYENTYENASVARTVIHLKAQHALIVVDELASGQEALFEPFWNVGPDFTAPEATSMPLHFTSDGKGAMSVVLAGLDAVSLSKGEAGATLGGSVRLSEGAVAALFQWTDEPAPAGLSVARKGHGEWTATVSGKGFSARITHVGNELTCEIGEG